MTARDAIEAVAGGVLVEHRLLAPLTDNTSPEWTCTCGEFTSFSGWVAEIEHRAHLAAVLAEALARVVAGVRAEDRARAETVAEQGGGSDG